MRSRYRGSVGGPSADKYRWRHKGSAHIRDHLKGTGWTSVRWALGDTSRAPSGGSLKGMGLGSPPWLEAPEGHGLDLAEMNSREHQPCIFRC